MPRAARSFIGLKNSEFEHSVDGLGCATIGGEALTQFSLVPATAGLKKRLRRSQIFIARFGKNGTSSEGATSNPKPPSMSLLAELLDFLRYHYYKDLAPTEPVMLSAASTREPSRVSQQPAGPGDR